MTIREALNLANKQLAEKIDSALENEVAATVKETEVATIDKVVYDAYAPKVYRRRGDFGGMADINNLEQAVSDGVLTIRNTTDPNPGGTINNSAVTTDKHLDELVEYGHGGVGGFYDFPKYGATFMKPRPFTKKTIEHLSQGKSHVAALKEGLKRQGVKTI